MEKKDIEGLILRYNAGEATESDRKELEALLSAGVISLEDFDALQLLQTQILDMKLPAPSEELDSRFYEMLADEKRKGKAFSWKHFFSWPEFAPKLALASATLVVGLVAGYLLSSPRNIPQNNQIENLSKQVSELQEMMMLSLLEKESATDRLRAVNLTQEMSEAGLKVTNALIRTLNEDENVNVRLAALDALTPYVNSSQVREALVRSIANQESPLMQVALAELMVALQEKSSVKEFEKIITSERIPAEVKKKIRESIQVLS
jgi:hypothetical protein